MQLGPRDTQGSCVAGHDPRDVVGPGAVDRRRRPVVAGRPRRVRPGGAVGERKGGREHDEPDERVFLRDVDVPLAAVGADEPRQLVGQAGREVVDVPVLPVALVVPGDQLEGEAGAHASRDVVTPRRLAPRVPVGHVAEGDVEVRVGRRDRVEDGVGVRRRGVVAGGGEVDDARFARALGGGARGQEREEQPEGGEGCDRPVPHPALPQRRAAAPPIRRKLLAEPAGVGAR